MSVWGVPSLPMRSVNADVIQFTALHDLGRNALQKAGFVSSLSPPIKSIQ